MKVYLDILEHMQEPIDIISCVFKLHMIKKHTAYEDEARSIGDRLIPKHVTTEAL